MENGINIYVTYLIFFFISFLFTLLANTFFIRFVKTLGIRNSPDTVIRWSPSAKPSLGGITFFLIFLLTVVIIALSFNIELIRNNKSFFGLLGSSVLAFMMGLADDAYDTRPVVKFLCQVGCGLIMILTQNYIRLFDIPALNYIFTIVWVVGIMNSINMIDNMDALASIVAFSILFVVWFSVFFSYGSGDVQGVVYVSVLSSILGFLFFNWHPSKIFMGDTGSQFLGNILAFAGINYLWNFFTNGNCSPPVFKFSLIFLAFLLPISDITIVIINRMLKGKSPFVGGKDHTSHHLSYLGFTDRQVALVYLIISGISAILSSWLIFRNNTISPWMVSVFVIIGLLIFSALFIVTKINRKN